MTEFWPPILSRLLAGEDLERDLTAEAMRRIMTGEATPAQVAAFAVALRAKGESPAEVAGLAGVMLDMAPRVATPGPAVDTCGTGGDRAAPRGRGPGAVVAKHGNRAASSRCG